MLDFGKAAIFARSWVISTEVQASRRRGYHGGTAPLQSSTAEKNVFRSRSAGLFDLELAPTLRANLAIDQGAGIRLLE
jgi:hypothetical protein